MIVPDAEHVQDSNSDPENEATLSNSPLHCKTESCVNNQDLPIAVRKGTRECTKRPLYPLTHFISFRTFLSSHKTFLVSLNTIAISNTVYEALANEK